MVPWLLLEWVLPEEAEGDIMKKILLGIFLCLILTPSVMALQIISVDTENHSIYGIHGSSVYGDTYTFSLSNNIFGTPPAPFSGTIELAADFGHVAANQVVHYETTWSITDADGTEFNVTIQSYGEKQWNGNSYRRHVVFLNGTEVWRFLPEPIAVAGFNFDYEDSHILQYLTNSSRATVPMKEDGSADWSFEEPVIDSHQKTAGRQVTYSDTIVSGLYYIPPNYGEDAFGTHNNSYPHFWLANVTTPANWVVTTRYQDRPANGLDIIYEFETYDSFNFEKEVDSANECSYPRLRDLVGICPSFTNIARFAIQLFPNFIAYFLDIIHPSAGGFLRSIGEIAGEFVASYVLMLVLMTENLPVFFLVTIVTISGGVNLAAAMTGNVGQLFEWHIKAFKGLAIAVFWYFYLYWLLLKWTFESVVRIANMIGNFIPFT